MAAPNRRKTPTRRDRIHEEILSEWFGCEKPIKLDANISEAADWIDVILKKLLVTDSINEEEILTAWKEIAGDFIGNNTQPVSAKEGHLILRVTQPAMRFHLEQMKQELLRISYLIGQAPWSMTWSR
jgi:hypothetical protein